jgi:hypothetical protein
VRRTNALAARVETCRWWHLLSNTAIFREPGFGYHLILAQPTPPPSIRESIIHAGLIDL